jgi:hypothetical protein
MHTIISKINEIADKLNDQGKDALASTLDKIAENIKESYKFRIHKQRKSRGVSRTRRKFYYKLHRPAIKRKQKIYRRRTKVPRKRRTRMKHYHRY